GVAGPRPESCEPDGRWRVGTPAEGDEATSEVLDTGRHRPGDRRAPGGHRLDRESIDERPRPDRGTDHGRILPQDTPSVAEWQLLPAGPVFDVAAGAVCPTALRRPRRELARRQHARREL